MYPIVRAATTGALLCLAVAALGFGRSGAVAPRAEAAPPLERLVVVSEDLALCESVAVFDTAAPDPVFVASSSPASPGRLAATQGMATILAMPVNSMEAVLRLRADSALSGLWLPSGLDQRHRYQFGGDIAVLPDDVTVLAAVRSADAGAGPAVARFRLPSMSRETGAFLTPAPVSTILVDPDGRRAHLVTAPGTVITLDVATMAEVAPRIQLAPFADAATVVQPEYIQAAMTRDGRHLIANRLSEPALNVADLTTRAAWTVSVPDSPGPAKGIALNLGWENPDLLAVHFGGEVRLYPFTPTGLGSALAGAALRTPINTAPNWPFSGPSPAAAWSATGSHLIAATDEGRAEFAVFEVTACGLTLVRRFLWTACAAEGLNFPNDILTANGQLTPPTDARPCVRPTPTAAGTITPGPTPTSTASPTPPPSATPRRPTPVPSPSPPATVAPVPIVLPLVLNERCAILRLRADTVLLLDTSSSMAGDKLAAAQAAAVQFLGLADLAAARDQVAIVRFDRTVEVIQPLTSDRPKLEAAIERLAPAEGTFIDRGLETALAEVLGPGHQAANTPVIVLLTDGRQTDGPDPALAAAERVRAAGVALYIVGLGADVDGPTLLPMAGLPDRYHFAPDSTYLRAVYAAVAHDIACPPETLWPRGKPQPALRGPGRR